MAKMPPIGSLSGKVIATHADSMVAAGLPSDFLGVITEARYVPYNYGGNRGDDYILALRLQIEPDADSGLGELQPTYYSLGDRAIKDFSPTIDGEEPVDIEGWDGSESTIDEVAGIALLPKGPRTQLVKGSNYGHLTETLKELGFLDDLSDIRVLEGRKFYWKRLPQRQRSGLITAPQADGSVKAKDILLPTEDHGVAKAAKGAGKAKAAASAGTNGKPTAKAAAAAAEATDDDMDTQITAILVKALEAAGGELAKKDIAKAVVAKFKGDKNGAIKRAGSLEYLAGAEGFYFDKDEGTLTLIPADE